MTSPNSLRPSALLALSMHSQPGVYAIFLGSGVSKGAGLPTGWDIVTDLVRRTAAMHSAEAAAAAIKDPVSWWRSTAGTVLGYSELLETVAATPAERQGVLEGYFEPASDEDDRGFGPSTAHTAVAKLVKRGLVKVIVTTNFDRLMEQALAGEGIQAQVVSSVHGISGMKPLAHASATLVKINGDYKDLNIRNTATELESYEDEWLGLLQEVFSNYGLVVSGWSAQWDQALAAGIEAIPNFRYPLYWDSMSGSGERAQQILAKRTGQLLEVENADQLFAGLLTDVEALDSLAQPQLTTDMAVAKLKKWLLDPVRRVQVHDLVFSEVERIETVLGYEPSPTLEEHLRVLLETTRPLLHLAATGIRHDPEGLHDRLWLDVLQRLLDLWKQPRGQHYTWVGESQHYPALLFLYTAASVAVSHLRDNFLFKLHTDIQWHHPAVGKDVPALYALHLNELLDPSVVSALPRWGGTRHHWPADSLIREDLEAVIGEHVRRGSYSQVIDDAEYRIGLLQLDVPGQRPNAGQFTSRTQRGSEGQFQVEQRFVKDVLKVGADGVWLPYLRQHGERHLDPGSAAVEGSALTEEQILAGIVDMNEVLNRYSGTSW